MENDKALAPAADIGKRIFLIRGRRVMLDSDLALMYGVPTHRLNEQVRRNLRRFPVDFMFRLTKEEFSALISQIAISKKGRGGRRKMPLVFTQEGVAMLSGVLHSQRAIEANIVIMRAFVELRQMVSAHKELAAKLVELERKIERRIFIIRGEKVMLDRDLAELYGVTTYNLNKAVARNAGRFPTDFAFKLNKIEYRALRFQIGILEKGRHSKYPPRVFTEQGVSMLSSVLRSERAIRVNVAIMRAFVRLREMISAHRDLAERFGELERESAEHGKDIRTLFEVIQEFMNPPDSPPLRREDGETVLNGFFVLGIST